MTSIRRLKPEDPKSPWVVEYTDSAGKRRRKTPKSGLKKDAEAIRQKIEREMGDGVHTPDRETVTIRDLSREYSCFMDNRYKDGRIGRTYLTSVVTALRVAINPVLGPTKLSDLTPRKVEALVQSMRDAGRAPKTIKMRLDVLSNMVEFGRKRGYTAVNPVVEVVKERRGIEIKPIRTFSKSQVYALLQALDRRPPNSRAEAWAHRRVFIYIAAFCGLRFGEIAALTPDRIDFNAGLIRVRASMTRHGEVKGPKTRAGNRDVPMPSHVALVVQEWIKTYYLPGKDLPLLHGERGREFNPFNFNKRWKALLDYAGLTSSATEGYHHFHALRHFAGSLMIENGCSVVEVSNILGHKHFDMTLQVYVHTLASGSQRVDAAQRMADNFMGQFSPVQPLMIEGSATSISP